MKALVTGGGGFLGGVIVRQLVARGDQVRNLSRGDYPELKSLGVEMIRGDLADAQAVLAAAKGCDVVFHVAAKPGVWGSYEEFHRANVVGTENIVHACRYHGIGRLVYTSSPSVVFDGRDLEGVNESIPYPHRYLAHYPQTKAIAERLVLSVNGNGLATVALRPHIIWGPDDNHLIPRVVSRAKAGKLRFVGSRPHLVDSVYVDNAAQAHLLAADQLSPASPVAGKVYFISNGEPLPIADLINKILDAAGLPPVTRSVSPGVAYAAGALSETIYKVLGIKSEPLMTRFLARQLSTAHWFDISAARRDFGYIPLISIDEGMRRLREWFGESLNR